MPPNSRGLGSHGYYGIGGNPVLAISGFRPKEKYLIFLVLATFLFVCFAAVFFLPDKLVDDKGGNGNKVYRVYKGLQDAGRDFILPAPPVATLVPAVASYGEADFCTEAELVDTECVDGWQTYGWGSIGLVVAAIGWAWPRGRHIVEEIADDIIEAAT